MKDILPKLENALEKVKIELKLSQKDSPPEKKKSRFLSVFGKISLAFLCALIIFGVVFVIYMYWNTPPIDKLLSENIFQTSVIYDRTGEHILYEMHGEENRKVIPHEEIPDNIRLATIAAEDSDFYNHPGIDMKAILRALGTDVASSEKQQGASTITQQLARNVFLSREKTFKRKFMEIILAIKIERNFNKNEILDMYLNDIPYGSNAYGIESATQTFFGKAAKDLTLDEASLLAALPNATTFYSPYGNHAEDLIKRQQYVLDRMSELTLINKDESEQAKKVDVLQKIEPFKQQIEAPHFVFYVKDQLEKMYDKDLLEQGGLNVYTTLDYDMQHAAEKAVQDGIASLGKKYNASNAALTAVDPKTGQILAMVGSKDYFDKSIDGQVNVAISPRQPGSSFKPFAYATAFKNGYHPETVLYDVPTDFGLDGSGQDYTPSNYDGNFHGPVTMRSALAMSLNIPAVKTLYLAGIENTINLAHDMGISTLNEKNRYGLALVLGGGEVTLLDETSGFSVFANDGKRNAPTGVLKIIDSQGKDFYNSQPDEKQVLDPQVARKINSILSDNSARAPVFGSANKLVIPGRTVAAKTGTTQEFHDAWTVGYTPSLATGVWVGNNDNQAMTAGADGSYVAAPIWNSFMSQVLKNYPQESFIDYDRTEIKNMVNSTEMPKIIYINNKSGKELSDKKLKKTDPDKISMKIEYPDSFNANSAFLSPETQKTTDPMILRWQESLNKPMDFLDQSKKDNKN